MKIKAPFWIEVEEWLAGESRVFERVSWQRSPFALFRVQGERSTLFLHCVDLATWQSVAQGVGLDYLQKLRLEGARSDAGFIQLWEDVWRGKQAIVKSRIRALLGSYHSLPARVCQVRRIDKASTMGFLTENHLQGPLPGKYRYGLFLPERYFRLLPEHYPVSGRTEILVAVAVFSQPRTILRNNTPHRSYELIRSAGKLGFVIQGGLDKLLRAFEKDHQPDDIMTYADLDWSSGRTYRKLGFEALEVVSPNVFHLDPATGERIPQRLSDESVTEGHRVVNSGSQKFLRFLKHATDGIGTDTISSDAGTPLVVILGPTASGKTHLAVQLARELNAEIISADSRQVYRKMDIGTGKDLEEYKVGGIQIPVHLIDVVDPTGQYTVHRFVNDCAEAVRDIAKRGKGVIICGGSGMYLDAVLKGYTFDGAAVVKPEFRQVRVFGLNPPVEVRRSRISARLFARMQEGMVEEVRSLLDAGLTPDQLRFFGLEYKYITAFLTGEIDYDVMLPKLETEIHRFAKRQMTFFRKMEREGLSIQWLPFEGSTAYQIGEILQTLSFN